MSPSHQNNSGVERICELYDPGNTLWSQCAQTRVEQKKEKEHGVQEEATGGPTTNRQ